MSPFLSFHLFKYCPQVNKSESILQSGSGNFIILGPDTQPILFNFRNIFPRQDTPPYLPLGPSMTIRPFCPFFSQQGVLFFSPLFALSGNLDSKPCTHDARETKQPSVSVSIARSQITVRVLDSLSPHILILLISKLSRQKLRKHKSNSFKKGVRDFSHFKISSSISSATHTEGHTLAEPPES